MKYPEFESKEIRTKKFVLELKKMLPDVQMEHSRQWILHVDEPIMCCKCPAYVSEGIFCPTAEKIWCLDCWKKLEENQKGCGMEHNVDKNFGYHSDYKVKVKTK